jgi:hypothetical protein
MRCEVLDLVREARTRTDERHFAPQDVDELRQLVEASRPEPGARTRDVVPALELEQAIRASPAAAVHRVPDVVAVGALVGIDAHRAELQDGELLLVYAETSLAEENRSR